VLAVDPWLLLDARVPPFLYVQVLVWLPNRQAIHVGTLQDSVATRHFGEAGLIAASKQGEKAVPRTASIVANEPCWLLVLPQANYNAFNALLPGVDNAFAEAKKIQERLNAKQREGKAVVEKIFKKSDNSGDPFADDGEGGGSYMWHVVKKQRQAEAKKRREERAARRLSLSRD